MDFGELYKEHKTAVVLIGGATIGLVGYSFLKGRTSGASTSASTAGASLVTPSASSSTSPAQYLVPYQAYYGAGSPAPSGGGTTTTTTGSPSSKVPPAKNPVAVPRTYSPIAGFKAAQLVNKQAPGTVYWNAAAKGATPVYEKWNPKDGGAPTGSELYLASGV
jgi:hypothetical protein